MQLKLLNYYKMLANVAGNLVGAFVPLIIYNATNSLFFACLFLAGIAFCRLLFCLILKKFIQKNPEICLMLRFFTIAAYCTCLNFLHINMIVMCIICIVFLAIDRTFKSLANETLFNYSSGVKVDSKKIGVTRVFEKLGIFLGLIVGGLVLDVSQTFVYVLVTIVYFVAIIPLFMYYMKNKKKASFNTELVSSAVVQLSKNGDNKKSLGYIGFAMLACYGLMYFSFAICDLSTNIFNLSLFSGSNISYSYASMFVLSFNIADFIGNMIIGKIEKKYDLLKVVRICFLVIGTICICLSFVKIIPIIFVCFALFGFTYSFVCAFVLQRLMQKSRILGVSNKAFVVRECSALTSYTLFYILAGVLTLIKIPIIFFFCMVAVMMLASVFILPKIEERTRKMLVDYVEDNEIGTVAVGKTTSDE